MEHLTRRDLALRLRPNLPEPQTTILVDGFPLSLVATGADSISHDAITKGISLAKLVKQALAKDQDWPVVVAQSRRDQRSSLMNICDTHSTVAYNYLLQLVTPQSAVDLLTDTFSNVYEGFLKPPRTHFTTTTWVLKNATDQVRPLLEVRRIIDDLGYRLRRSYSLPTGSTNQPRLIPQLLIPYVLVHQGRLAYAKTAEVLGIQAPEVGTLVFQARESLLERSKDLP